MPGLPLKQRLAAALTAAGFRDRQDQMPVYSRGGTFEITAGQGALVSVAWWDASDEEKEVLLGSFGQVLRAAGFDVEKRENGLYVAEG